MDVKIDKQEICVLCCRETNIFAVGSCDHCVCYECSTRMRVLCQQNECPICRSEMPLVIFTKKKQPFMPTFSSEFCDKEYMIVFENEEIQKAFYKLLEHRCPECKKINDSFKTLEKHVRREHSLNYCLVCADNLKLFSFERRCYNRKDLAHHNRKGDIDDKSHRGHPECESCQKRYMDRDELFRHMRKEHYFCHFCDADLKYEFFEEYNELRNHFRKEHFLCEEDDCAKERFISVFRTDIDLKVHKATKHTRDKTKEEIKRTRTLDVEILLAPRRNPDEESSSIESRRGRNQSRKKIIVEDAPRNNANMSTVEQKPFNAVVEDFPSLSNGGQCAPTIADQNLHGYSNSVYKQQPLQKNVNVPKQISVEDFPALSGSSTKFSQSQSLNFFQSTATPRNQQTFSQQIHNSLESRNMQNKKNESPKWKQNKKTFDMSDFPVLESAAFSHVNNYPTQRPERPQSNKQRPTDESLSQQLYLKCKTESKNTPKPQTTNHYLYPKQAKQAKKESEFVNEPKDNKTVPMSLMYGGIGKYNPVEDPDNRNLIAEKVEENERRDKAYRHRNIIEEEVPWREEAKLDLIDDFPPLESNNIKRPPGFDSSHKQNTFASPPGFSDKYNQPVIESNNHISLSSIAQQLNCSAPITLQSNSNSQINKIPFSYQEPVDFQERNYMLICKIKELIGSDSKLFDEFKLLSGNFRKNKITAADYYSSCLKILEKDKFLHLFSELLCLLPDIQKQQELSSVHEQYSRQNIKPRGAVPKKHLSNCQSYITCPVCLQILAKQDVMNHQLSHSNGVNYLMK